MAQINHTFKIHDLVVGTEFTLAEPAEWAGGKLFKLESDLPIKKESLDSGGPNPIVIGDHSVYYRVSLMQGGMFQSKVRVYAANNLLTNLTI